MTNLELVLNMLAEATTTEIFQRKTTRLVRKKQKNSPTMMKNCMKYKKRNRTKNLKTNNIRKICKRYPWTKLKT